MNSNWLGSYLGNMQGSYKRVGNTLEIKYIYTSSGNVSYGNTMSGLLYNKLRPSISTYDRVYFHKFEFNDHKDKLVRILLG